MRHLLVLIALGSGSLMSAQDWSAWQPDPVFNGIKVRARCAGFNEFANRYLWDVQLRNDYQKDIDLAWAAEPELLRGAQVQADRALGVRPGEVVNAHHTAPQNCSSALLVKVDDVQGAVKARSFHPTIEGHWRSKDPEPLRKELDVRLSGNTVTTAWSSPSFSIQISTALPQGLSGSVSLDGGDKNPSH